MRSSMCVVPVPTRSANSSNVICSSVPYCIDTKVAPGIAAASIVEASPVWPTIKQPRLWGQARQTRPVLRYVSIQRVRDVSRG